MNVIALRATKRRLHANIVIRCRVQEHGAVQQVDGLFMVVNDELLQLLMSVLEE